MDVEVIKPILLMKVNNNSIIALFLTFNSFSLMGFGLSANSAFDNINNEIFRNCMFAYFMV